MTGDELRDVVNGKLFPYLAGFKRRDSGPNTIEYKIGEVKVLDPKIGERICDGACGSAGFRCEAFDHVLPQASKADDLKTLKTRTGAMAQGIKASLLKRIPISFANTVGEQAAIVDRLDSLAEETSRLERLYASKLAALDKLKRSLLHLVFTGALSA